MLGVRIACRRHTTKFSHQILPRKNWRGGRSGFSVSLKRIGLISHATRMKAPHVVRLDKVTVLTADARDRNCRSKRRARCSETTEQTPAVPYHFRLR